jgi:hypothetical protein
MIGGGRGRGVGRVLTGVLAACLVCLIAPAVSVGLSRTQATRVVLRALSPRLLRHQLIVFGLKRPLGPRARVFEAGPGPRTVRQAKQVRNGLDLRTTIPLPRHGIGRRAWLFWVDEAPYTLFEHQSEVLLIDDRTGRMLRRTLLAWYPLIDGARPSFLSSLAAYESARYRVFSTVPPASGRRGARRATVTASAPTHAALAAFVSPRAAPVSPPNLAGNCMITIGDREDAVFKGDFQLAHEIGNELGLHPLDAQSASDLDQKLTEVAPACADVMLVIAAHGYPGIGQHAPYPNNPTKFVPESAHAQVDLGYSIGKDASGKDVFIKNQFDSESLIRIIKKHPTLTFKIVVSACFSGRWKDDLADYPQVRFVAAGARRDQFGKAYYPSIAPDGQYYTWHTGTQSNGMFTEFPGTMQNHTTNHTQATEFTNGILHGLDTWAHSKSERAQTGNDLAKALVVAFDHERDNDFVAQLGLTQPVMGDYTGRPIRGQATAPHLTPLTASFYPDQRKSVYEEHVVGPIGDDLTFDPGTSYRWSVSIPADSRCALGFAPAAPQPNQATWAHADTSEGGYCDHTVYDPAHYGHPGTVTVTVSTPAWVCTATYFGTQGDGTPNGVGPEPPACTPRAL